MRKSLSNQERTLIETLQSGVGRREVLVIVLLSMLAASAIYIQIYVRFPPTKPKNLVGIIRVEGYIVSPRAASQIAGVINQAILNESVKAVVLVIDSGGGFANYIEQIYLDLLELKEKKPVIASVVTALSGGYYIAVAADYIYANPTSFVGNIGVIGSGPPVLVPSELVLETGVHKATGFSKLLFPYNLSRALDNFVSAVELGRVNASRPLKLSSTQLRRATIYLGSEAVDVGLADEEGAVQKAVKRAAEDARLVEYEVVEIRPWKTDNSSRTLLESRNVTLETLNELHPPPAIHYIYLPPQAITQTSQSNQSTNSIAAETGEVLIDMSHGNQVSWWDLDILIAELAKRNATVNFIQPGDDLGSKLSNASSFIVASPTEVYTEEEQEEIGKFLDRGGLLLMFFDPAWEYIGEEGLSQRIIAPINSLSTRFGLSFAKGYLYNEKENYGIYRNIYVKNFTSSPLTQNLSSLVLFTATYIRSMGKGLAWTSSDTYSSVAERPDNYAPIALVRKGNGTVAAFGDLTFLGEPYSYVEDNYQLILNLASFISEVEVYAPEEEEEIAEEVARPDLPVGTEKNYTERVDGNESLVTWLKISETEVRIDRPNETTHYYLTEEGALQRWVSNGIELTYEDPLPEPPYPLTKGESWKYESNYTLTMDGETYAGKVVGKEQVEGFEDLVAGDGEQYFSARVRFTQVEELLLDGSNMTIVTAGSYWVSSDAGTVKLDTTTRYYMDGIYAKKIRRTLLLKSIRKGKGP